MNNNITIHRSKMFEHLSEIFVQGSKSLKLCLISLILFLCFLPATAQQKSDREINLSTEELEAYKKNAKELVAYMEHVFNLLGDKTTAAKDKDIIVNESYLKLFANDKVQIQDDLDEKRNALINKDVQAYLKDIDFFFTDVKFKFTVEEINHGVNDKGEVFLLVNMNRNLQGETVKGKEKISTNKVRFVEININDKEQDIKIASIYTEKLNEEEDLQYWWKEVPSQWKQILGKDLQINDTLNFCDILMFSDSLIISKSKDTISLEVKKLNDLIRGIVYTEELDLSGNTIIQNIAPLSKLTKIKTLNLAGTAIIDLMPIRSLTRLEWLNCSKTGVESLLPLKYATNLKELYIDSTKVSNIEVLSSFEQLQTFHCVSTGITSLEALANLSAIQDLRFRRTSVSDLTPLANMQNLQQLDCSETSISDISVLDELNNLQIVYIENTQISTLKALNNQTEELKIYCDKSKITKDNAEEFMASHPKSLVMYRSETLLHWWKSVPNAWKKVFNKYVETDAIPAKDEIHQISNLTEIDISKETNIKTLYPVKILERLKILKAGQTGITSVAELAKLNKLEEVYLFNTKIRDISPLKDLHNLKILDCHKTNIEDIASLNELKVVEQLNIDDTKAASKTDMVLAFIDLHPECLVIYQTLKLKSWWTGLAREKDHKFWKEVFLTYINFEGEPTNEQLHKLAAIEEVIIPESIKKKRIKSLNALSAMSRLKKLDISGTGISNLNPIKNHKRIEILNFSETPVSNLTPLKSIRNLKKLAFSGTQISDLEDIESLTSLKELNISATKVRNLRDLENMKNLEYIDCSNTKVMNIKPIYGLKKMKTLKCFNTKVWERQIKDYKSSHKKCEVVYY